MRFRLASLPLLALLAPVFGAQLLGATPATPAPALSKEIPAKDSLTEVESKKRQALELYLRAKLLAGEAEFEESVRLFRKAVELDPADGQLRLEFAEELRDLGVFSEAEVQARKAVELLGGTPITRRTLGQILLASARDRAGVEAASAELKSANDAQPLEPSGAIAYAQTLLRLERPAEAVPVLEKILDKGRGSAVILMYGEALQKSGKLAEAQEVYESIRDREPENRAAAVELLRVYERSRQLDRAIPILEEFVKSQPGNIGIKTEYAVMLLRVRRFADSARVFEEVLKADPGNKEALRYYASLLSEQQKIDEADAILKRLEAVDPDDLDASYRRGINFLEARRLDEAEKVLLGLREKAAKQSKSKDGAELAQIDGQLGYVAYLRKDYALARKRVQPVLFTKDPDEVLNGQAFNLLAQIARDDEKPAEGLALVREVLAKVPEEKRAPALVGAHGEFLARSSDPKDQAEGDKVLAALAAKDRLGALAAADAWQRLEKHDKAVATAKIGLQATPNDPDLLFRLAASLERDKKIPEAVAAFEKLLAVRPDHAPALNYVGYMWAERNENLDKARAYIQKAVDLEPGNGAYLDSLGWVYFQLGQLDNAEKYLKDAARLNPDDSAIEDHLGDLYAKKGDLVKARAAFTRALALKPEDGGEKLRKKLSALEGKVEATRK